MNPITAVEILRAAADRSPHGPVKTKEVKAALVALKPRCPERWPLDAFWEHAGSDREPGRTANIRAAFNGILRQLGLPPE